MSDGPTGKHGIKLPVSVHGDCETGLSDADGQILFEATYAKHSDIPKAQLAIQQAMQAPNGYGKAVEALERIEQDGNGWGQRIAWKALKDLGELNE